MQLLSRPAAWLSIIILILGAILSLAGLLIEDIYSGNSLSLTAQARGQDLVTLCIAVPALLAVLVASLRGSIRGTLALAGLVGYFLYTYASYAFMNHFNVWFFAIVAAFSCSLFAFVVLLARLTRDLPALISTPKVPLRACAVMLLFVGAAVLALWLAQLLPALSGGSSRVLEESGGKPVIQALDLGVFVPAAVLAAVLVVRGRPTGVVWVTVLRVKGLTLALGVVSMTLFMARAGTPDWGGAVIFSLFSLLFLGSMIWLFSVLKLSRGGA